MLGHEFTTGLSRRVTRRAFVGISGVALAGLLVACEVDDDDDVTDDVPVAEPDDDEEEPVEEDDDVDVEEDEDDEPGDDDRYGGTLNVALTSDPPTLDIHQTTADIVALVTWHIYEPLFTWSEDFELIPELSETHEVSDDGLTETVTLRQGVTFHNGEDLTSADVVASFERWSNMSALGADLREVIDEIDPVDDHTVEFQLNQSFGAFATLMSRQSQGFAIYPASVVEESTETELSDFIGTGPYQFVEQVSDQHVHLERFDDYAQAADEPDGYGGHKYRYLDDIYFIPVPDEAARVAGLQAGDYDYLDVTPQDQFDTLDADPNVTAELLAPAAWGAFVLNTAEGPMANQTLRQAIQAALNHEEMAQAGYGEGFFNLDPAIMHAETVWHTTAGEDLYNQNDPDRAMELMEEAGYDGSTIRILTSQERTHLYNMAVVAEQQLEDVGFDVELRVFDWPTVLELRQDPAEWELFQTNSTFRTDPVMQPYITSTDWPGWWDSDRKVELANQLLSETDFDARFAAFEEMQELFYEEVPIIKTAEELTFNARSNRIQGFTGQVQIGGPGFWNIWVEDE